MATKTIKAWVDGAIQEIEIEDLTSPSQPLSYDDRLYILEDKPIIEDGNFLVGNGTDEMEEITPVEVLEHINGASIATLTTAEYEALEEAEETNANTLYMLTDEDTRPDLTQNDETAPDYVKGRTHWVGAGEILPETTINNYDADASTLPVLDLVEGEVYTVNLNGVEYDTVCMKLTEDGIDAYVLGDIYTMSGGTFGTQPTGEPFVLMSVPLMGATQIMAMNVEAGGTIVISVKGNEVVHKLDNKYLNLDWLPIIAPTKVLATEKTVTNSASQPTETTGGFPDLTMNDVTAGEDVLVIWDGEEYKLKVQQVGEDGDAMIFIGDINMIINGTSIYPFFFMLTASRTNVMYTDTEQSHIASVMGYEYNKIPLEYLPDDLVIDAVPTARTINGKALSSDITLSASDVGALPATTQIPSIVGLATESYVDTKVTSLVDSAPETLNTLNELATALGDDPNFATTITTELGNKSTATNLVNGNAVGSLRSINAYDSQNTILNVDGVEYLAILGENSVALGYNTVAIGARSFAEGSNSYAIGDHSHAEGYSNAIGKRSHAEGGGTKAKGENSHSEGTSTIASGYSSHSEGGKTTASAYYSHAEGFETSANGHSSHAEGKCTITTTSSSNNVAGQHVQGRFNLEDTDGVYAHIVGNGKGNNNTTFDYRSNAHTVDWSGNAWYQGDIYVGSTSGTNKDDGSKKVATEEYVDNKELITIADIDAICNATIMSVNGVEF